MIKLKDLLPELKLKKNKWTHVPSGEINQFANDIHKLITIAYKSIGGHPNYKSKSDITPPEEFEIIDLDKDPDVDVTTVDKNRAGGKKSVAIGHDGSKSAKSAAVNRVAKKLKIKGHYVEVSGKLKDILQSKGVAIVDDEETVKKALKGKIIKWHGDGTYDRQIGGKWRTKTLMGKPRV